MPTMTEGKLCPGEVHVWRVELDKVDVADVLSAGEIERAGRMRDELKRARFVARKAELRRILSLYVGGAPKEIEFEANRFGKPRLAGNFAQCGVTFNVSSSMNLMLAAFASGVEIGVDVEAIKMSAFDLGLIDRYLAPAEARLIRESAGVEQEAAFFTTWAMKEAVIKALGAGLTIPLAGFIVDASADGMQRVSVGAGGEIKTCALTRLDAGSGYAAAMAAVTDDFAIKLKMS